MDVSLCKHYILFILICIKHVKKRLNKKFNTIFYETLLCNTKKGVYFYSLISKNGCLNKLFKSLLDNPETGKSKYMVMLVLITK